MHRFVRRIRFQKSSSTIFTAEKRKLDLKKLFSTVLFNLRRTPFPTFEACRKVLFLKIAYLKFLHFKLVECGCGIEN